jgi:hypothetical protein
MGWQDAPEVNGPSWASAPLVDDEAKQQLAREISPLRAGLIGAGAMADRGWAGMKQAGLGVGAVMSELLTERMKGRLQNHLAKRLTKLEEEQKAKAEEYAKLQKEQPVATTVGEIAPLIAAPMLRVVQGAGAVPAMVNTAASTALPGLIEYGTAEERALRGAAGAAGGAVGSGAMSALGKAGQALTGIGKSTLTPEAARVAGEAARLDIPLTAAQQTGNKAMQAVESTFEWLPSTSATQTALKQGQREAFTRGVMRQMGEEASDASPKAMAAARKRIGGDFDRIFGKVKVDLADDAVQERIGQVLKESIDQLSHDQSRIVAKRADELLNKIDQNGAVSGKAYQAWRTSVQQQAQGTKDEWLGTQLKNLYRAVDDAAYKAAEKAGEAAALTKARAEYTAMKTVLPLAQKSTDGMVSPGLLQAEVVKRYPGFMSADGGGDMGSLARIGKRFIAENVPNSGTAQRQAAQAILTGTLGYGVTGGDAEKAAYAAAGGLLLPKAAQLAINSPGGQRFLAQGFSQAEAAALRKLGGLSGLGVAEWLGP